VEPDEDFFVLLSNPTNALIRDGKGEVLILNDDGGGLPSVSIADVKLNEGNTGTTTATFTATLSSVPRGMVTVNYATVDGSAKAGSDYVANKGMLTFQPGTTTQTVSVMVNGDSMAEPTETFFVVLTNPVNATIDKGRAVGVIINDDGAVQPVLEFS